MKPIIQGDIIPSKRERLSQLRKRIVSNFPITVEIGYNIINHKFLDRKSRLFCMGALALQQVLETEDFGALVIHWCNKTGVIRICGENVVIPITTSAGLAMDDITKPTTVTFQVIQ